MKRLLYLVCGIMCVLALAGCSKKEEVVENVETKKAKSMYDEKETERPIFDASTLEKELGEKVMEQNVVELKVKNYGTITLELKPSDAPITVANFKKLIGEKFYDGLTFHRIIQGFMIQGGDPQGTGMGGSDQNIKGEFKANGVDNKLSHTRGAISMARASDPNSASSQFFICDADDDFLDGNYAVFGYVTSGMDVVDKIASDAKPIDQNGTIPKENQPVIEYIKLK